jgi:cell division protein ZapA
MPAAVELRVGGQTYRVVASAEEPELRQLAAVVDAKLRELTPPGRAVSAQTMLLAAIALAHELEQERTRRQQLEQRSKEVIGRVLAQIDQTLAEDDAPPAGDELQPNA